jgi:membrane fusion protein, multidrug efflux system
LQEKKEELEKLRAEKSKTEASIQTLQDEIEKMSPGAGTTAKSKLVGISVVGRQSFNHFIDLQGHVDAENISYISPRMGPAQVKAVYVQEGQQVKKGQLLLKLDDAIIRQQVTASRQQLQGIKTQLNYSKTLYDRQKNLWDQGIGTEVQLITARTNMEGLQDQLKAATEQVKVAEEQLSTTNVTSDVNGIADVVNIKVGETFTGMGQNGPQIKIVNTSNLKVVTNIPENYISRLHKGSPVEIQLPDANKSFSSVISLISQSIDLTKRGFVAEAKIPYDRALKPNQTAIVKILDYSVNDAIVIPVNTVQSDETGKYVFVYEKRANNKAVAKRKTVVIGEIYNDKVEIKSGLSGGEQLITEGYQNVYEGQIVATQP